MNRSAHSLPCCFRWILNAVNRGKNRNAVMGDMNEFYDEVYRSSGRWAALAWCVKQLLKSVPRFIITTLYWRWIMFKNALKLAWRHVKRHKGYAFINVLGLALSIVCCTLMLLWVVDELSYDRFYPDADRIFRVCFHSFRNNLLRGAMACPPMAPTLVREFPEVIAATRVWKVGYPVLRYEDKIFSEERWFEADSSFFEVLRVPFIAGDPKTALYEPNTVVITQSMATKYFGDEDPMGKILSDGWRDVAVTGVIEDVPHNSHFHFDFIVSGLGTRRGNEPTWISNNYYTYFQLREGIDWRAFEEKLREVEKKYIGPQILEMFGATYEQMEAAGAKYFHFLQPLTSIRLHSDLEHELEPNGDILYVYIFSIAAFGILLLAVINFINLSTARSSLRAREVGIRKTVGSTRSALIRQFLTESILYTVVSASIAVLLVELIKPAYNQFTGKVLAIPYLSNPLTIPVIIGFVLIVGSLAGIYPAFFLASFKPVIVLKDSRVRMSSGSWMRNGLVIFQFTVAVILISGAFVVQRQLNFIQAQKFEQRDDRIVVIHKTDDLGRQNDVFKQEILENPAVFYASNSSEIVGGQFGDDFYMIPDAPQSDRHSSHHTFVDADYASVYNLDLIAGSFIPEQWPDDRRQWGVVLNESAVERLKLEHPVGSLLESRRGVHPVYGVVKDFHYRSVHHPISALVINVLGKQAWGGREFSVRIAPYDVNGTLTFLEKTWKKYTDNQAFEYEFFDSYYDRMYRSEIRTGKVFFVFSLFALFIAGLGLFGLSSFIVEKRTKEIGIRKVVGASSVGIVLRFVKDLTRYVVLANLIAWPAAYFLLNRWLADFAYRVSIGAGLLVCSGLIAFLIAVATVSIQCVRATRLNTVDTLRYE